MPAHACPCPNSDKEISTFTVHFEKQAVPGSKGLWSQYRAEMASFIDLTQTPEAWREETFLLMRFKYFFLCF
jgi:hypothetical protein